MAITKSKKSGVMGRLTSAITPALVGAAVGVIDDAVGTTNSEMVGYGSLAAGIVLPVFMKGTEKVGDSLAAVGGFMTSKNLGLAEMVGLTDTATTTGLGDKHAIGNYATKSMFVGQKNNAQQKSEKKQSTPNPIG